MLTSRNFFIGMIKIRISEVYDLFSLGPCACFTHFVFLPTFLDTLITASPILLAIHASYALARSYFRRSYFYPYIFVYLTCTFASFFSHIP